MAIGKLPVRGGNLDEVRRDVEDIIRLHGISAVLTREVSKYGNSGEIIEVTEERYNIYVKIDNSDRKNRNFSDAGLVNQGEIIGYFFYEYPKDITRNKDLIVQVGDKIKDQDGVYWRIEEINTPELEGKKAFRKGTLRRIS